jgi:hypothetical protein
MRTIVTGGALAALVGTALAFTTPVPASAQLARPQTAIGVAGSNDLVTDVQWRRGWRGGYRGGWRGGYRSRYYGPGIGLGLGLATGAIIGGALAGPRYYEAPAYYAAPRTYYEAPAGGDATAYCMQRFKSYDPSSGTYLGYDGERHPCP